MLNLVGLSQNLTTLAVLAHPFSLGEEPGLPSTLRAGYLRFLAQAQPAAPVPEPGPCAWVQDADRVERLARLFNGRYRLNDFSDHLGAADDSTLHHVRGRTELELAALGKRLPGFTDLFGLAMAGVFTAPCATAQGGTSSAAVGFLWIAPGPTWTSPDYQEFLVHELTHTLMFLDERRYEHFQDPADLAAPETWATSAVLARRRPLDKVLHSIVVATEVLLFRALCGDAAGKATQLHPDSALLRRQLQASIGSVLERPGIEQHLTPRALDLVAICSAVLNRPAHA